MKKLLGIVVLGLLLINPAFSEDTFPSYSKYSVDENIHEYNWKVDKVRSTNKSDIYYLKNNKRLLNCVVTLDENYIDTYCNAP
tara:strand:- start:68 stop:316 length:249 start_codon:yes stop_codon:yes gene_type:complete